MKTSKNMWVSCMYVCLWMRLPPNVVVLFWNMPTMNYGIPPVYIGTMTIALTRACLRWGSSCNERGRVATYWQDNRDMSVFNMATLVARRVSAGQASNGSPSLRETGTCSGNTNLISSCIPLVHVCQGWVALACGSTNFYVPVG